MAKYIFKIVLIGDGAVGKTSIRRRYMGEGFNADFLATMGADFAHHRIKIDEDTEVEWQIWDLAGQPAFRSVMKAYFNGSMGALAVYDVTQPRTLEGIDSWVQEAQIYSKTFTELPVVIIGNKIDLRSEVPQYTKTIHGFTKAKSLNAEFIETSAKTGENIDEAFNKLAHRIMGVAKERLVK
ncbi:MAG: Rab family GTPase [Candidatus Hodarchaeales archaeon]|jgi:small GTP-binding protein